MTPPRILLVTGETFAPGGIQRFNRTLLDALLRLGCPTRILTLNETRVPEATGADVRVFARDRVRFAAAILREVATGAHDVVIVGHVRYARLVDTARRLRRPGAPQRALLVAHGLEVWNAIGPGERGPLRRLDAVLCVSGYTRDSLLEQVPGLDPARTLLFPNALARGWQSGPAVAAADPPVRPFILSVARLDPREREKGIVTALEAFAGQPPPLTYVIAGDGPDRPFLERCAARLGIAERVRFAGRVDDAQLAGLYARCAAFVLPSAQEGFGIVYLEAMAFGAPVIASAEKGALDVIAHGRTGLLVPFGDVPALTAALDAVRDDAALRERLRSAGRAQVEAGGPFTADAFRDRLARVLGTPCHEAEAAPI